VRSSTAKHGPASIHLVTLAEPFRGKPGRRFDLTASNGVLDEALRAALPKEYQSLWKEFQAAGSLDLRFTKRFVAEPYDPDQFVYTADATLHDVTLDCGVKIQVHAGHGACGRRRTQGPNKARSRGDSCLTSCPWTESL